MEYPSKLIEDAVNEVSKLPGIGKKTALRLVLHLVKENENRTLALTESLNKLRANIRLCKTCFNISDDAECAICRSHRRDHSMVCVVEESNDVMAIENTSQYHGVYHVLGGVISPINGIGPSELKIEQLLQRLTQKKNEIQEVILALSPTMEGDTTAFYINRKLKEMNMKVTSIARGVPVGGNLEYTDEITLGRSITARIIFD
ncbi:MAG: Recombination protein RecR [Cytophagales bacterium]|jgi:recombination protein RecR|nr:recombination protein RecR [Bacteroidota bacterium]MBS1982270.1 recombination protein RecR [Bacteroidota bacterium]WHZ07636.1 MAG: Recombination protein RecR [Cytophagales bacterium]